LRKGALARGLTSSVPLKKVKLIRGDKMLRFLVVALAAVVLSGCAAAPERDRNTLIGAGVGAGVGALIGSASGGPPGAWVGAAIGAASGGAIGYLVRPEGCYIRNQRGELWQVPCHGRIVRASACFVGNEISGRRQVPCPYRI
jgi:uncharacterized protein YcfJ